MTRTEMMCSAAFQAEEGELLVSRRSGLGVVRVLDGGA